MVHYPILQSEQESYTVTVSNQGANSFAYTITPSEDWIVVSKKSGTVKSAGAFEVSIDFSKVKKMLPDPLKFKAAARPLHLMLMQRYMIHLPMQTRHMFTQMDMPPFFREIM